MDCVVTLKKISGILLDMHISGTHQNGFLPTSKRHVASEALEWLNIGVYSDKSAIKCKSKDD
jgi:hypothetical protein